MGKEKKGLVWDYQRTVQRDMNGSKDQIALRRRRTSDVDDTCGRERVRVEGKESLFVQTKD